MPFNPLNILKKEIHLCPDCHHVVIGHYKWLRHKAACQRRQREKARGQPSHMKQHRWRSWSMKVQKEKERRRLEWERSHR